MAQITLFWSPDPDALLARAAAPFTVEGRVAEPLPLLVVRQGGIRDAVLERAAAAGCAGWLGEPIVVFQELPERLAGALAPLDPFERQAMVRRLLAAVPSPILHAVTRSFDGARRTDALLGDLVADRVTAAALGAGLDRPGRDDWERQRDAELVRLYEGYLAAIDALPARDGVPRSDGRDGLVRAAEAVRSDPEGVRRRLRRPFGDPDAPCCIDVYGLADLRRGWGTLLDALHGAEAEIVSELRVHVLRGGAGAGASDALWEALAARADRIEAVAPAPRPRGLAHLRDTLFSLPAAAIAPTPDVAAIAAPDMERELEAVVARVKRLIVDDGVAPPRIAIVARQARPYANRAVELLTRAGVPATARLRHTLSDVGVVGALLRLLRAAEDGWTAAALAQLSGSPYLGVALDPAVLDAVAAETRPRTLAAWRAALDGARDEATGETDADGSAPALVERITAAREGIDQLTRAVAPLDERRPIGEWIALTLAALGCPVPGATAPDDWAAGGVLGVAVNAAQLAPVADAAAGAWLTDAVRRDMAALRGLVQTLGAWRAALDRLDATDALRTHPVAVGSWRRELEAVLRDGEVAVRTVERGGVQVVEALAAEGRAFDHVFVVGMSAGAFPMNPPAHPLFGERERAELAARALPLEPARVWFEREAALFHALVGGARQSLTLSYSYADADGTAQLASAYHDEAGCRFVAANGSAGASWESRIPGSALVPTTVDALRGADDLLLFAARGWRSGGAADIEVVRAALAHAAAHDAARVAQTLHAAAVEHARGVARSAPPLDRRDAAHAWNGAIDDPALRSALAARYDDRIWSATALERYGRCGFTFLAHDVLGARALRQDEEDELSAVDRGTLLHDVLARVYGALVRERGDAALDPMPPDQLGRVVGACVDAAIADAAPAWTTIDGLRVARTDEIRRTVERYVRWEMQQGATGKPPRRAPAFVELDFGSHDGAAHPAVTLATGDGRHIRLRGRIDRIDRVLDERAAGWHYVVDHKTGTSAFTGVTELRPAGAVLQLALYLAVVQSLFDGPVFGGAYQIVTGPDRVSPLDRASLVKAGLKVCDGQRQREADAVIAGAPALARELVDGIVAGRFAARTPGKVKCLAYCDLRDACREERMNGDHR